LVHNPGSTLAVVGAILLVIVGNWKTIKAWLPGAKAALGKAAKGAGQFRQDWAASDSVSEHFEASRKFRQSLKEAGLADRAKELGEFAIRALTEIEDAKDGTVAPKTEETRP
jgi:hypothetical protein